MYDGYHFLIITSPGCFYNFNHLLINYFTNMIILVRITQVCLQIYLPLILSKRLILQLPRFLCLMRVYNKNGVWSKSNVDVMPTQLLSKQSTESVTCWNTRLIWILKLITSYVHQLLKITKTTSKVECFTNNIG